MNDGSPRWRYLELESPDVRLEVAGVTVAGGTIALAPVPASAEALGADLDSEGDIAAPAGIGIDAAGNVYVADARAGAVVRVDACDGSRTRVACAGLDRPGGVAVGPRDELYVAETGRHRVVMIDLASGQAIGYRGTPDPYGPAEPGSAPGRLDEPVDVAVDWRGNLLVADRGNRRVQRFTSEGRADPGFWERVEAASPRPAAPAAVAVGRVGDEERILVVDARPGGRCRLLVYDRDGALDRGLTQELRRQADSTPALFDHPPGGVAAGGERIFVGDPARRRILAFGHDGRHLGALPGYRAGAAGLELDTRGRLLANPGGGGVVRFAGAMSVGSGTLVAGPFDLPVQDDAGLVAIRVTVSRLPDGAQFRLHAWPDAGGGQLPPPLAAGAPGWIAGGPGARELVLRAGPASRVWVGALLEAGEAGGPVLGRLRVAIGLEAWIGQLPALYARDEESRPFLERLLALLAAGLEEQEERIADLPLRFDAAAAPDDAPGRWLDWLAGWLAFPLGDIALRERRRAAVAAAFGLAARRGTAAGLVDLIRLTLGVSTWVSEPGQHAELWRLDGTGALGFQTALLPAEAQGAVLGTTATLDRSDLIADEDFGAPLYDDLAHRFCVGVPAGQLTAPGGREALERLVERERPGHTRAHVCVVEPRARVGFQARVGVDAIVAGAGHAPRRAAAVGTTRVGDRGG